MAVRETTLAQRGFHTELILDVRSVHSLVRSKIVLAQGMLNAILPLRCQRFASGRPTHAEEAQWFLSRASLLITFRAGRFELKSHRCFLAATAAFPPTSVPSKWPSSSAHAMTDTVNEARTGTRLLRILGARRGLALQRRVEVPIVTTVCISEWAAMAAEDASCS